MKAVMTQAVCKEGMEMFEENAELYIADDPDPHHYQAEMRDADILIVRLAKCDAKTIDSAPNLKVIGRTGVGVDSVDVEAATARGIPVVITPGANTRSVAEHAVALMFALSKNLCQGQSEMIRGNWEIRGAGKAFELFDKKVGIIGLGAIGKETLKLCRSIQMRTAGYDPYLKREEIEALGAEYYGDYTEMMKECDIVSVHVPLIPDTKYMIGMRELKQMKKTAFIINCSRGGVINETDLAKALKEGVIAGAGVDVFEEEPIKEDNPVLSAPNTIVSPHSAAQTKEAVIHMARMCVEGCMAVCRGERWPYVADERVYEHERWKGKQ